MPGCNLLDIRCIFVSEIVGSAFLTMIIVAILFFMFVGVMKIGFRTSIVFSVPVLLMFGTVISGFSALFAFLTLLIGMLLATVLVKILNAR